MVAGALTKDALRTVRGSLRRFLSIAAICMLGTTMLIGLTIACEDLRLSADEFFDAQRLYDVSVQSTRERHRGLMQDLASLGWSVMSVWSVGAFVNPDREVDAIVSRIGEIYGDVR